MNEKPNQLQEAGAFLALCRADPSAFIEFVSGYTQGQLHIEMQDVMTNFNSTYCELPRGHGKTDQSIYRDAWEIGHDPNILIKVVKATDDEAAEYVQAVRDVLESERYHMVFPEISKDEREWGKTSLRVRRPIISKDPTIKASGIFGNPGGRADILRFDDVATLKNSVHSPTVREQVKEQVNSTWFPMLKKGGKVHRICTPWHINDVSADWRKSKSIHVLRRPCVGTDLSPWPEYWTPEMLAERLEAMGDIAYSRAYLLQPITGSELVFQPELLLQSGVRLSQIPKEGKVYAAIDLAFRKQNHVVGTRRTNPDYSVATLARIFPSGDVYPFKMIRMRATFPEFKDRLQALCNEFDVQGILAEEVGALITLNEQIATDLKRPVIPVKRNMDKHTRAIEVQSVVQRGQFHLPVVEELNGVVGRVPHPDFKSMYDEMTDFPFGEHDDTVDTVIDLMKLAIGMRETTIIASVGYNPYAFDDILRADMERTKKKNEEDALLKVNLEDESDGEDGYFSG